ncbi:MAG TPA: hypothetical protein VNP98_08365 [Chthoniobacterales bacterium]|nr:hypothetical protein [Chthoniobacterales bacterium]
MLRFSLPKYLLLALFLWIWAAETPAQELEISEAVAEEPETPVPPPPVPLSPAESNFVEADEFAPPSNGVPSATAMAPEEPAATAPFPAPPPMPEIELAPPAAPPQALFTTAPTLQTIQSVTPLVEVWPRGATSPQIPQRYGAGRNHHQRLKPAYFVGHEPVTVLLRFHPSASGKSVMVRPAWGLTVDPPDEVLTVAPNGECIMAVTLDSGLSRSHLSFFCDGLTTTLALTRVVPEVAASLDGGNGVVVP